MHAAEQSPDTDTRAAQALAHPLRVRILATLRENIASPRWLATELKEPLGNVAYHVRRLVEFDCLELVREEKRRGALEHYYRATERPAFEDDEIAQVQPSARRSMVGSVVADIWRDASSALDAGGFDRDDFHVSRTPLSLDDQGWRELSAELRRLYDRGLELQDETLARGASGGSDAESQSAELAMLLFDLPANARSPERAG